MPPTLLVAGNLVPVNKKDDLSKIIPIEYILDWFKPRMNKSGINNRVLILKSDTGSGKSTVFPAHLYKWLITVNPRAKIAVSQPRVLTAISIVREELIGTGYYPFLKLGENIGWKTGSSRRSVDFGLTYMTVDSLAMQLRSRTDEQIMDNFQVIILDEVHELGLGLTYVLYMLKNFLLRNKDNPKLPFVVTTSATFDVNKYIEYFGVDNSSLIQVIGSTFPKHEHFASGFSVNYVDDIAKLAVKIHEENLKDEPATADILAFVPGAGEAEKILQLLVAANVRLAKDQKPVFLPLFVDRDAVIYGKREHDLVFAPHETLLVSVDGKKYKPLRRIILSTNVAETGLTISTLKYMIESGISREVEYYPTNGCAALVSKPVTMSRFKQRIGRIGRKFPGEFYTLYPKDMIKLFHEIQYPDMITTDMANIILPVLVEQVKTMYVKKSRKYPADTVALNEEYDLATEPKLDVLNIDLIDGIPADSLHDMLEKLYALGFIYIDDKDEVKLTKLGHLGAQFSLRPESTRMIMAAYAWGCCAADLASIAVYLDFTLKKAKDVQWHLIYKDAIPSHYTLTGDAGSIALKLRTTTADTFMDGLFLIRAMQTHFKSADLIDSIESLKVYCTRLGIENYHIVIDLIKARDALLEQMFELGFNPFNTPSVFDQPDSDFNDMMIKMKYCIYDGYRLNMLTYVPEQDAYMSRAGLLTKAPVLTLETMKTFKFTQMPKRLLYNNISLKQKKDLFVPSVDKFSALDGYVNPDDYFLGGEK